MRIDKFLKQLEEYQSEFNCYTCDCLTDCCDSPYSCSTQCLKQFLKDNNLKIEDDTHIFEK